jgi:hypothetical protein
MTNAENGKGHRQQTIRQMRVQETGTAGFWKIPCSRVPVGRVGAARRAAATGHSEPFNESLPVDEKIGQQEVANGMTKHE